MPTLTVKSAGPGLTVQDLGRPGFKAQGLSTGGAADPQAIIEAAALLGTPLGHAAIEMMGLGGVFVASEGTRICLTGAQMQADIGGEPIGHNCTHFLPVDVPLTIKGARAGVYGYLSFAGGIQTPRVMESRATHLTAGIGKRLVAGDQLPIGADNDRTRAPRKLPVSGRFDGGLIRIMAGPQTDFFDRATLDIFAKTTFRRSPRGNRQGIRLDHDGDGFGTKGGLNHVSDLIVPGDIQMTGDGVPYVLLAECQTIGGYPRIGSVIPLTCPKLPRRHPERPCNSGF